MARFIQNLKDRETGIRNKLDPDILPTSSSALYQKDIKGHYGCVNAVEFSTNEILCASGGDDCRVLLWRVCDLQCNESPKHVATMNQLHASNIFALAFSSCDNWLCSAGNDSALYFHDVNTSQSTCHFKADAAIYNVSFSPSDDTMVITASDDGSVRLHDRRASEQTVLLKKRGTMYCAQFNPVKANVIAVCNSLTGLALYDCRMLSRKSLELVHPLDSMREDYAMYARWSDDGKGIFATCSHQCPSYFDLDCGKYVIMRDENYRNICTVKSCSFITDDLVMTGSDDWNIYIWKIPKTFEVDTIEKAHKVLKGHRSIVNHSRYSPLNRIILSSGVEKIIKLWSPIRGRSYYAEPKARERYAREHLSQLISTFGNDSMDEDLTMLAFFDSLTTENVDADRYAQGIEHLLEINDGSEVRLGPEDIDLDNDTDWTQFHQLFAHVENDNAEYSGRFPRVETRDPLTTYVSSSPELSPPEFLNDGDSND